MCVCLSVCHVFKCQSQVLVTNVSHTSHSLSSIIKFLHVCLSVTFLNVSHRCQSQMLVTNVSHTSHSLSSIIKFLHVCLSVTFSSCQSQVVSHKCQSQVLVAQVILYLLLLNFCMCVCLSVCHIFFVLVTGCQSQVLVINVSHTIFYY